jgi:hypothetical protein
MATYSRPGVYIQEVELPQTIALANNGTAIGAFVGPLAKGPVSGPVLVTSWTQFTKTFGNLEDAYPVTWAAYNFFANGGQQLYIKRCDCNSIAPASTRLVDKSDDELDTLDVFAANPGAWGNSLGVQIRAAGTPDRFTLVVYGTPTLGTVGTSNPLEQFTDLSMDVTDPRYAISMINTSSAYIRVVDLESSSAGADKNPIATSDTVPVSLANGADGNPPMLSDYVDALEALDPINNPLVINIPNAAYIYTTTGTEEDYELAVEVQGAAINYAELRGDCFVIVDIPASLSVADAQAFVSYVVAEAPDSDGGCAAAYYSWLLIPDTLRAARGATRLQAPGAAMVGQYLATDAARGVFKTPAGYANRMALAVATETQFTNSQLDSLNTGERPINVIRQVPGNGIVVMGGRTLNNTTGDRYINVRRSITYVKKEITDLSSFAIFENNDERLWSRIRTVLGTFLRNYWQSGGLRGATAEQAYFVRCDSTTTSDADILNGLVNIEIGIALEYPAEFVVIKLGQITGNATA